MSKRVAVNNNNLPEIAGGLSSFLSLSTVSSIIFIPSSCSCIASNFNLSFAAIFSRFAARNFRFALERMLFAIFEFSTCLIFFEFCLVFTLSPSLEPNVERIIDYFSLLKRIIDGIDYFSKSIDIIDYLNNYSKFSNRMVMTCKKSLANFK